MDDRQINWYDEARDHMHRIGVLVDNWSDRAVIAAALERGVTVTAGPRERILLTYEGREHWWRDGLSSLNPRLVMRICKRKDVLSSYLLSLGHPALPNQIFAPDEAERAWAWGSHFSSLVIKPADGTGGVGVVTDLSDREEFLTAFAELAESVDKVLVEEYREGKEYRFLAVRGRVVAIAHRAPAHVVGDGKNTVQRLIDHKNEIRWRAPNHKMLRTGTQEQSLLVAQELSLATVPRAGQVVMLRSNSNLKTGGDAIDATDQISPEAISAVEAAARSLPGARLLGLDVLISEDCLGIIEVNAGPMISMHHLPWEGRARDVGGVILEAMFPALRTDRSIADWVEVPGTRACDSVDVHPKRSGWRYKTRRFLSRTFGKG